VDIRRVRSPRATTCVILLAVLAACSRHRSPDVSGTAAFATGAPVFLDAPLRVTFAAAIDPAADIASAVELLAIAGPGVGEPVRGTWRITGRVLEFVPELAHEEPVGTRGGLQPGTRYELRVRGDGQPDGLRAADGRPVVSTTFAFETRPGQGPAQLFGHNPAGGPRLVAADVEPQDAAGDWRLGRAFVPSTMRLRFDQPLHPAAVQASPSPLRLTWDDPVYGAGTDVDVDVELVQNNTEGATVVLRPRGVLPSRAEVRLVVAPTLRDLFGEHNVGTFVEPLRTFRTEADDAPRSEALVFDFASAAVLGPTDFGETQAVVQDGALRVPDAFPAVDADVGDWVALDPETVLRTDVQELVYQNGVVKTFDGGVLPMRNLHVPVGCTVRGQGPNPLVLVVDGDAWIEGSLSVDGADVHEAPLGLGQYRGPGDSVPFLAGGGSPPAPPAGVSGGPAGGRGGSAGARFTALLSVSGGSASGVAGGGGQGGAAASALLVAAGGGGGGAAVQGDPWFPSLPTGSAPFPQRGGVGGAGSGGALPGGAPGSVWFTNADPRDDFWGRAYVPQRGRSVIGELSAPRAGSGGGSGGSWSATGFPQSPSATYLPGGGGGGGGGVLVLQVRGRLTIAATGRVSADGGNGVGGTVPPYLNSGSGGGGGAGSVVLMAGAGITLHVHGETFANRDYDFCLSADGGICATQSSMVVPAIRSKYPANGETTFSGEVYGANPLGGFGGMGLVQLMVPVGGDNADGTNTVLDDAITVVRGGVPLVGVDKQRYLGWRGFADENGVFVDDLGLPTGTIGGQGDIRPDPVLLPVPWSTNGTARARSTWLPLGALHRRALAAPDGRPRGVVGEATTFGAHARSDGWLPHGEGLLSPHTSGVERLAVPATIVHAAPDPVTLGYSALAIELAADLPDTAPGSYTGCIADIGGAVGGSWTRRRVLYNTARTLLVDGGLSLPDGASRVQLQGWFAELATPEPGSYVGAGGVLLPRANVRIGFAFHRAPSAALQEGVDPDRLPPVVGTFLHDLTAPSTRAAIRAFGPRAVQWDVLLDGEWRAGPGDQAPPAGPRSAIALRRFFLPVRF
jgi:hypothetical protein